MRAQSDTAAGSPTPASPSETIAARFRSGTTVWPRPDAEAVRSSWIETQSSDKECDTWCDDFVAESSLPLVSLRDVAAGYDGKEVLSGVSLDIYRGDFLIITGPNGGGKTTLVKIIMGLLPHSGSVKYYDSLIVNGIHRIGYLPQQHIFDRSFPISVVDVVVSGLQSERKFTRRYTQEDFSRARKLLKMTGIAEFERIPIGEISGGQMQRTLLCRALIAEPRMLILDEPTTYVDSQFENLLYTLLRELNIRKVHPTTIVVVSHNANTLSDMAQRVIHVDGTIRNP